jgi:tRNA nucleotidyltransferase (CCA-adding enzyme)
MENINLACKIEERLPQTALAGIKKAVELSREQGVKLFLVGGVVRDLLLMKPVADVDIVIEGNAIVLAQKLSQNAHVKTTIHEPFLTATLEWPDFSLDLATARRESYSQPGALPVVQPGSLQEDLSRRDFSVNAMAVSLNAADYGQLIDYCGGLDDLYSKSIRVLHQNSFTDDATRIWRAVRYEQRLDFRLETKTEALLQRDLPMLKTVSGERIWYELECVFSEMLPEKVFARASELGLLHYLHPQLCIDGWLATWFDQARRMSLPNKPADALYLALLSYPLDAEAGNQLVAYLHLNKTLSRILRDIQQFKADAEVLNEDILQPSAIYQVLHAYSQEALMTGLIASESAAVRRNIELYLNELRYVKTSLTGDDLIALGVKQGPGISLMLGLLLDARLDGEVASREDEVRLTKQFN